MVLCTKSRKIIQYYHYLSYSGLHWLSGLINYYAKESSSFFASRTNMCPGACVIHNDGLQTINRKLKNIAYLLFITTACGVTPQAQNTGTSPAAIVTLSPKSGLLISFMPIIAFSYYLLSSCFVV